MVTYQLAAAYYAASFKSVRATVANLAPFLPLCRARFLSLSLAGSQFPLLITKGSINLTH